MKTKILIIAALLFSLAGMAQRQFDPQTLELIKTKKIAFLTEELSFTSLEAQKFWPVYNELEKERYKLMDQKRELEHKSDSPNPGMTDADYRKLASEIAGTHAKESGLIVEYNQKFLNILPAEKVVKLYRAEAKFRASLMHDFKRAQKEKNEKDGK